MGTTDLYWPSGRAATWPQIRDFVLADFPVCAICRTAPATEVDHIWPRHYGGTDVTSNLQPACGPCNRSKGSRVRPLAATERELAVSIGACMDRAKAAVEEMDQFLEPLYDRALNRIIGPDPVRVQAGLTGALCTLAVVACELDIRKATIRRMLDRVTPEQVSLNGGDAA